MSRHVHAISGFVVKPKKKPKKKNNKKKLRYNQMESFHQIFQYTPSNLSDFIEFTLILQSSQQFLR